MFNQIKRITFVLQKHLNMKTKLPQSINTIDEAKNFLTNLSNNGESYHPEDDATDLAGDIFTKEEGEKLNSLMNDIYNLEGNNSASDMVFDPCEFILNLDPEYRAMQEADLAEYNAQNK